MKKTWLFIMAYIVSVGIVNAAVRDDTTISRNATAHNTVIASRTQTKPRTNVKNSASRATTARTAKSATPRAATARATSTNVRTSVPARTTQSATVSRAAQTHVRTPITNTGRTATPKSRVTRATIQSNTFGTGYNACRDAYFTCMDQFCATQNDTYRRCACSSRLNQIKSRENLLSDTANQLQDFKDFNISVIDKSAAEVNAMIHASAGEAIASSAQDKSASAQQLTNISNILAKTKSQSLSTSGTLDIGGDIKQIWKTTDLADGANIANLTGESLYNAVHAQCSQMVAQTCESKSTLNMVVSAYGMYIENDCTTLSNSLDSKTTAAKGSVRDTEREMHNARLENYNAHNSTTINDCIANVRADLTADTACGPDYVHCLDVTGRYLNRETGEPIYTSEFYQLDGQISLSGNILNNQTNRMIVAELNRMRSFAESSLDTCRDIADAVWDEFVRQAITEIYQGQQSRIRDVKNECLDVVNACYDEQSQSLKDFSNVKEQLLLGQRLELSEELCREKLEACSNLYGGGTTGLSTLVSAMHDLTDSKIAKQCRVTLQEFARDICAVPSNDTLHGYPYACRVYYPGEQHYAKNNQCNQQLSSPTDIILDISTQDETSPYICTDEIQYTSCNPGYYMVDKDGEDCSNDNQNCIQPGNDCVRCLTGHTCAGGKEPPQKIETSTQDIDCGNYPGSLYQRMVRYALQSCVRPSDANNQNYTLSADVLSDVNAVMDSIRVDMGLALAKECERWGGVWVNTQWDDEKANNEHKLLDAFYDETGANTAWGYCREPKTYDQNAAEADKVAPNQPDDGNGTE